MTRRDARVQEIVEQAAGRVHRCRLVAVVRRRTEANLRWAANALTTNGEMSSRDADGVAPPSSAAAPAVGTVERDRRPPTRSRRGGRRRAAAAAAPRLPEDAAPLGGGARRRDDWDAPARGDHDRGVRRAGRRLGEAFGAGRPRHRLYGFAEHASRRPTSAGTGLRRAGPADRPPGANAKTARPDARSAWAARSTRDFTDVDVATLDGELSTGWGGRDQHRAAAGAVRDAAAAGGGRRPDDLRLLDGRRPRRRGGAQRLRRPGGGTRVGERLRLPITLCSDPRCRGSSARRSSTRAASADGTWVFDDGLPLAPTTGRRRRAPS